ncbi:MAG: 50S ribosomal protein L20 [Candidatus Cloacimonetes bacterium]|nr:50S ribosomal protein L20 [Candidatus Cloacimonadota bacterium]
MRVKTGIKRRKRHKKIRKLAKGFRGHRGHTLRGAKEGAMHAERHAYTSRRLKKRDIRRLWITRLSAAVREHGLRYSEFIKKLKDANIELDRKVLSEIARHDPKTFEKIVEEVKKSQNSNLKTQTHNLNVKS